MIITLFQLYLFYCCFIFYKHHYQHFGPHWSFSPIGFLNKYCQTMRQLRLSEYTPPKNKIFNEVITVGQWGSNGLQRASLLKLFSVKFVTSEINLIINGPCWSWSSIEFPKKYCWLMRHLPSSRYTPLEKKSVKLLTNGVMEKIFLANEEAMDLVGHPSWYFFWNVSSPMG